MRGLWLFVAVVATSSASAGDLSSGVVPPSDGYRWEGAYVGGSIGGAWTNGESFGAASFSGGSGFSVESQLNSSFTGGVQAGYNYQIGKIVVGFEGDISYGGAGSETSLFYNQQSGSSFNYIDISVSAKLDWYSSLRLRVGLAPNNNILVYATGGLAVGQITMSEDGVSIHSYGWSVPFVPYSSKTINVGWIAGAGAEYSIDKAWSLRAEALYMSLGTAQMPAPYSAGYSGDIEMGVARAGLNYMF